jgi:hypothetical protein
VELRKEEKVRREQRSGEVNLHRGIYTFFVACSPWCLTAEAPLLDVPHQRPLSKETSSGLNQHHEEYPKIHLLGIA